MTLAELCEGHETTRGAIGDTWTCDGKCLTCEQTGCARRAHIAYEDPFYGFEPRCRAHATHQPDDH